MSTNGSTEPPITGDEGTHIAQHEARGSETAILSPVEEAAEEAAREHRGDLDSPLLSDGIHVPSEGLHDELQYSRAPNTSPPTPDSQEAHDDPGSGGKQIHSAPSRVDEPAGNEDKTRAAQHRTHRWQTQQLAGWAAVEKTLTDFDQQEVSGYKEDIDSLLTFAGLYSGVLTAFVIVSFTQLQEDTAAESLKVLRIIANQTANATATMLTAPPFQPSLTAKRVNVLWFASLIISLSTASLAILVKQWLRGYMAFASSSPQGQLRIRHFRRSGLETWRVFGIASMLPLLLQISLALFFIGLCFFTADIDPVIGYTTLPLVCSWAFLFITVTLAPAVSARCPYKIPALSMVTAFIRTRVWDLLWCFVAVTISLLIAYPFKLIQDGLRYGLGYVRGPIPFTIEFMAYRMTRMIGRPAHGEEVDVLNDSSRDLAILAAADAVQANSELDLAIVKDVLKQRNPNCFEALEFLIHIISNRVPLPSKFKEGPSTGLINSRLLSTHTKAGIVDILRQYVTSSDRFLLSCGSGQGVNSWASLGWRGQWATCISLSLCEPGGQAPESLHPFFISWFHHFVVGNIHESSEVRFVAEMFTPLCLWINQGYTTTELPQNLDAIQSIISSMGRHIQDTLDSDQQSHRKHSNTSTLGTLYNNAAHKLGGDMISYWKEHTHIGLHIFDRVALSGTIWTLCRIAEHWGDSEQCKDILISFIEETFSLKSDAAVRNMLISVLGVGRYAASQYHPLRKASDRQVLLDIVKSQGIEAHMSLINALCLIAEEESSPEHLASENLKEATIIVLQVLKSLSQIPTPPPIRSLWRRPFLILTRWMDYALNESLPILPYNPSWLISIGEEVDATLSINAEEYLSSSEQRRNLQLPDIFCLALGAFVDEQSKAPIWTAKHLRDISPEERAMIIAEGREEIKAAIQAVQELRGPASEDTVPEAVPAEHATVSQRGCLGTVRHWWRRRR